MRKFVKMEKKNRKGRKRRTMQKRKSDFGRKEGRKEIEMLKILIVKMKVGMNH